MARIKNREKFIKATATIVNEPMDIQALVFGATDKQNGTYFTYQTSIKEGKTAKFTSFSESAEIVEKEGIAEVKVKPFLINRMVTFDALDAEAQKLGQTQFSQDGGYASDIKVMGKMCHLGALKRRKMLIASVLAYHNLTEARDGVDADFNIPATNREVKTTGLWNASGAPVIEDMRRAVSVMKSKPTIAIMNPTTYLNMMANGDLIAEANTNNLPKNFELNTASDNESVVYRVGKVIDVLVNLNIYVWNEKNGNDDYYLPDGYVAYTNKRAGLSGFAGVYVRPRPNADARYVAAEWYPEEIRGDNPTIDGINYKSAPIPIAKDNQGFYSQKVF